VRDGRSRRIERSITFAWTSLDLPACNGGVAIQDSNATMGAEIRFSPHRMLARKV
jgi:hypothetical protein